MHFIKNFHLLRGILSFLLKTAKYPLNSARVGKLKRKEKRTNTNKTNVQSKNKPTQNEAQGHDEKTRRKKKEEVIL